MEIGQGKQSSSMINGSITSDFDLNAIYHHLKVSNGISCIKFNNKEKSLNGEKNCKTFNNQISLKMTNGLNIKLFSTGAFSVSGAGKKEEAIDNSRDTLEKILIILKDIFFTEEINPVMVKNFYTYYGNSIITPLKNEEVFTCRNFIKDNKLIIDKENCEEFHLIKNVYIQIKHKNKVKKLYNNLAEEIGYVEYNMNRKTKSLCIKNCKYSKREDDHYDIINKYNNVIGTLQIHLSGSPEPVILPEKIKIRIKVCEQDAVIDEIKYSNCNYNFQIKLASGSFILREKICEFLSQNNVNYTYDPCSYPGVKFSIDSVKITIFRTGSILCSSKKDIFENAYPFLLNMFENDMTCSVIHQETEEELTIWDI